MTIDKATIMLIILVQIIQEVMLWLNISAAHDIAREVLSLECRISDIQKTENLQAWQLRPIGKGVAADQTMCRRDFIQSIDCRNYGLENGRNKRARPRVCPFNRRVK